MNTPQEGIIYSIVIMFSNYQRMIPAKKNENTAVPNEIAEVFFCRIFILSRDKTE
jgi:hypothetical protein